MHTADELFRKGMEFILAGEYGMAELHFERAKELTLKTQK